MAHPVFSLPTLCTGMFQIVTLEEHIQVSRHAWLKPSLGCVPSPQRAHMHSALCCFGHT